MSIERLAEGLHIIRGLVHVYVLETDDGLMVLDSGFPGKVSKILDGIRALGKQPKDVRHIVLSHAHPDHIGSAAALKRATGATVWAHPIDAPIIEAGAGFRPVHATPGLLNRIITNLLLGRIKSVEPTQVDRHLSDGEYLPFLPDLQAIHAPGHCAGQIALHWQRHGGVLFTADTCVNFRGPQLPPACEDILFARKSLDRLAQMSFDKICFMHGRPILQDGDRALRRLRTHNF